MRGFVVDETYRVEHGKAYVYLFGRLEDGKSFCTINHVRPYFCIRKEDEKKAKKLPSMTQYDLEPSAWETMEGEQVVKVVLDNPRDVPQLRKLFEDHKIPCYEADVRFTHRFLMDKGILRSLDIDGSYEKGEQVDRIYKEPALTPSDWYPELRILSFDIESSMDLKTLYSISLVCRDKNRTTREVLLLGHEKKRLKHAKSFPDEKSLLDHFRKAVLEIDPDIITGWNTIDFDLSVLRDKFKQHDIPFRLARMDWDCTLRIESSFFKESTAEFPGRQVLDGIQMLKLNFIQLDNYKLATAAKELLGDEKLIGEGNKGDAITSAYDEDPQLLVDYNLKDSELVLDILDKTHATDIMVNRAMLTGMSLDRVRGSIASFDSLYLRELRKRGVVAPTKEFTEKEDDIGGGYVMDSRPGIYDNIIVLDFKSLYPSMMRTFNIDPLAYAKGLAAKDPDDKDKWIVAPNGAVFSSERGILPDLLERLWKARDAAKKRKDERASFAIKILMNSFFGVLAAPNCRFFSMEMANAITSFGRHLIQLTAERIRGMGYDVIYGDTDSVFVDAHASSPADAQRIADLIVRDINEYYDQHIQEEYRCHSHLELELDKIFIHFMMPKVRGSEQGAKKRYAGIVIEDGKEELQATGLEIVRRDWTDLAKNFQTRLLTMIFGKQDPQDYIRKFVRYVKEGKLDHELTYQKAIRKDLAGYVKTTPPHVKAARILEERGIPITSNVIEYVMTVDGPYPLELMKEQDAPRMDYDHYVEKQLKPIADAILSFYGTTFDDLLKGGSQKTLGSF